MILRVRERSVGVFGIKVLVESSAVEKRVIIFVAHHTSLLQPK